MSVNKLKQLKPIWIPIISSLCTLGIVLLLMNHHNKKIAVVDAIQLFNSYNMKMDLEHRAKNDLQRIAFQADSIKQILQNHTGLNEEDQKVLFQELNLSEIRLERAYEESNQTINEQVWGRLNPIIDEFGKQKKLRVIIGANGMGSILYYNDYYDVTEELIHYVNKKYENGI